MMCSVGRGVRLRLLHLHVLVLVCGVSPCGLVLSPDGWRWEDELLRGWGGVRAVVLRFQLGHAVFEIPDVVD